MGNWKREGHGNREIAKTLKFFCGGGMAGKRIKYRGCAL